MKIYLLLQLKSHHNDISYEKNHQLLQNHNDIFSILFLSNMINMI